MARKFIIIFLISIIVFFGAYLFFGSYLDVLEASAPKEVIRGVDLGEGNVIEQVVEDEIFFLLTGVDNNVAGLEEEAVRTDTLMLVKANMTSGKIDLISIPRDSRVLINGTGDKINHAHSYGGMALTLKTIREWLGIDLDYYVKLDFQAVVEIVDAMGGVYLNVPVQIYEYETEIFLEPGYHRLRGKEALYFARFRGYEDGDIGRVASQQALMAAIVDQALRLENLPKIPEYIKTYASRVDTNIPTSMVLGMVPMAENLSGGNVNSYVIPGYAGWYQDISYYFYDPEQTQDLVNEVLYDYKISELNELAGATDPINEDEMSTYEYFNQDFSHEGYNDGYYEDIYTEEGYYEEEWYPEEDYETEEYYQPDY